MKDRLLGLVHCGAEKKQMINEILDTDYTVVFIYCNSVIRVIRV
jgi:hypothetical protein